MTRPRPSFAGAAIEVSDLGRSIAFHRLWLPMLGFHRVWASPDRVMWSRGYDHFVMRQAKHGVSYGPGALWLAVVMATALHPARAADVEVNIDNFTFAPQRITVEVGTTVTWHNEDDIPHTVTANNGAFRSKVLDTGDRFTFTFAKAGEYDYFCSIHPRMTGKIIVKG